MMLASAKKAADMGFTDVLLGVAMNQLTTASYQSHLKTFVTILHDDGLKAHAEIVSGNEALSDPGRIDDKITNFLIYHTSCTSQEQFDGVHADIEPHVDHMWDSECGWLHNGSECPSASCASSTSSTNETLMQHLNECYERLAEIKNSSPELEVSADIAYWYDKKVNNGCLNTGMPTDYLDDLDFVTIMAYDDDAADITNKVQGELSDASGMEDSILVMVNTTESNEGDPTTFWEEGWTDVVEAFQYIEREYHSHYAYHGFGVYEFLSAEDCPYRSESSRLRSRQS